MIENVEARHPLRKTFLILMAAAALLTVGCPKPTRPDGLYTIGIFQVTESTTLSETRKGFIQALENAGLRDGVNVRLKVRNAMGDVSEVQRIAEAFVREKVDLVVPLSTPCLQAALIASKKTPIVFASVANPYLVNAGRSARDHGPNVTGVSSSGPIKETLAFIRKVLPAAKRVGTLWTPSEINSEYYLELARQAALRLGMEIVAVPVDNSSDVLLSAQLLLNKKIDAVYQISDNTINAAFETLGRVAEENGVPLFGGFLHATRLGAAASMGWDFYDMGLKAGALALRIKAGEQPGRIPFESMSVIKVSLNPSAAARQGIVFAPEVLKSADEILASDGSSSGN
jgi:putative ABC transport system substrate-binding protein